MSFRTPGQDVITGSLPIWEILGNAMLMSQITAQLITKLDTHSVEAEQVLIYAPALAEFPRDFAPDALTLPLCNTNRITTDQLLCGDSIAPTNCYCSVFALDPFLQWNEFGPMLRAARFNGICNYPPLADFEEEERRALAASDYTFEVELDRIAGFAGDEFDLLIVCSTGERLTQARNQLQTASAKFCLLDNISMSYEEMTPK